jgi:TPR repeat protein
MEDIEKARELRKAGSRDAARDLLLKRASDKDVAALVELAYWAGDDGDKDASDRWIDKAEECLERGDWDGHAVLNSAYTLGFGRGSPDEIKQKALAHLEVLARAGNPAAQERLAVDYLNGSNGCRRDPGLFEGWISKAVAQGSVTAAMWYAEYLLGTKRPVPSEVIALLEGAKQSSKDAQKLLRQLAKRRK